MATKVKVAPRAARVLKGQVASLCVREARLPVAEFPEEADARAWASELGFEAQSIQRAGDDWRVVVRAGDFLTGSDRTIFEDDGTEITVALPIRKAGDGSGSVEFDANELHFFEDVDVFELTLCRTPILGTAAQFAVKKAEGAGELRKSFHILKADSAKRQVFGCAVVSDLPDTEGDIFTTAETEATAFRFMRNLSKGKVKGGGVGHEHEDFADIGHPIASWFDKAGDIFGVPGSWVVGVQVEDELIWKAVESGEITGFSIGGKGRRRKAEPGEIVFKASRDGAALVSIAKAKHATRDAAATVAEAMGFTATTIRDAGETWEFPQGGEPEGDSVTIAEGVQIKRAKTVDVNKAKETLDLATQLVPKVCEAVWKEHDAFVVAMFVDSVVFEPWDERRLFMCSFDVDNADNIVLGEPVEVERRFIEVQRSVRPPLREWTDAEKAAKVKERTVSKAAFDPPPTPATPGQRRVSLLERIKRALGGASEAAQEGDDMKPDEVRVIVREELAKEVGKAVQSAFKPIMDDLAKFGTQTDKSGTEGSDSGQGNSRTTPVSAIVALAQKVGKSATATPATTEGAATTPPATPPATTTPSTTPAATDGTPAVDATDADKAAASLLERCLHGIEQTHKAIAQLAKVAERHDSEIEELGKSRRPGRAARRSAAAPDLFMGLQDSRDRE